MSDLFSDIDRTIQLYVADQLSPQEQELFEAYMVSQEHILEQVETAQNMRLGIEASEEISSRLNESSDPNKAVSPLKRIRKWLAIPIPAYAVAALCALFLVPPLFINGNGVGKPVSHELALARFSAEVARSQAKPVVIDFSQYESDVGLLIKVKAVDYPNYLVKLVSQDGQTTAWQSNAFQFSALLDQLVVVPGSVLSSEYRVEVYGVDAEGILTQVQFCGYQDRCD